MSGRALLLCLAFVGGGLALRAALRPSIYSGVTWSHAFFDRNGIPLRLVLSEDDKYRFFLPLSEYPAPLRAAILEKEDRYFYFHPGVNPAALARAAVRTYFSGGRRIGGSSITMQLARLKYGFVSRTESGKLQQIALALWLELLYSKDQILEAYLNLLPYGGNVEGLATASWIYFGKKPERLSTPEIYSLAVIPQSPALRTLGARGELLATHKLIAARDRLFRAQLGGREPTEAEAASFRTPMKMRGFQDLPFHAPHFTDDLLARLPRDAPSEIHTTLDLGVQRAIDAKLKAYVARARMRGIHNAAAMLIDARSREVLAAIGSAGYFNAAISGQVNGTQALRSPGSTLKPFAYGLAFDQGVLHPRTLLKDSPGSFGAFDPENFDKDFQGPISAEDALIHSRNLPAVRVATQLRSPDFFEFLTRAGVRAAHEPAYYGLTPVLGGLETTMEDLVRLYAALRDSGRLAGLRKLQSDPVKEEGQILSPEASYMVLDILKKVSRPFNAGGTAWERDPITVAWKTGTSHGFRDAWSVGIFGHYVLAVWIGNFDGEMNPGFIGIDAAAPLFFEIVDSFRGRALDERTLTSIDGRKLKQVRVCALSGQIPGPHCQHTRPTWFLPGTSPISACEIHREILVDRATGKRLCDPDDPRGRKAVFEVWPSDLLKLFAAAGVPRALPPPFAANCKLESAAGLGLAPKIVSPKEGVEYSIRASGAAPELSFAAVTDGDSGRAFWFLNDSLVGSAKAGESFLWKARPGKYLVRVVDDHGRSDSRELSVRVVE